MKTEIEAKFLNVDFDEIRTKLTDLGASLEQPMRLMRRAIVDLPNPSPGSFAFLRVRDEGDKVTMTYKQFDDENLAVTGAQEIEVIVSDFEKTVQLLEHSGLKYKSYQETKRETWCLDDVEIVLDEWPWLNPYIEIEGISEQHIKETARQLGFEWKDAVFGAAPQAYEVQYPHGSPRELINIPRVAFDEPIPDIISGRKADGS
jgi:adenylate cyclase, class 2